MRDEILTPRQNGVLRHLAPVATSAGLYLAGGTAIALHLGHRRSDDFDWFSDGSPLDIGALTELLRASMTFEVDVIDEGTLVGTSDGVRVACFAYRYPRLEEARAVPEWALRLAGLRDLAAMKLLAITQRGSRKDFIDVYALLEHGLTLPQMLDDYCRKFSISNRMSALRGLVYFDDAEAEAIPEMLQPFTWDLLKDRLRHEVERSMR